MCVCVRDRQLYATFPSAANASMQVWVVYKLMPRTRHPHKCIPAHPSPCTPTHARARRHTHTPPHTISLTHTRARTLTRTHTLTPPCTVQRGEYLAIRSDVQVAHALLACPAATCKSQTARSPARGQRCVTGGYGGNDRCTLLPHARQSRRWITHFVIKLLLVIIDLGVNV